MTAMVTSQMLSCADAVLRFPGRSPPQQIIAGIQDQVLNLVIKENQHARGYLKICI